MREAVSAPASDDRLSLSLGEEGAKACKPGEPDHFETRRACEGGLHPLRPVFILGA